MDKAKDIYTVVSKMPKNQLTFMLMLAAGLVVGVGTVGYYIYNKAREQFEDAHQYGDDEDGPSGSNSWNNTRRSSVYSAASASSRGRWCTICLMDVTIDAGNIKKLEECGHEFHEICINPWLRRNNTCPVCRHEINL